MSVISQSIGRGVANTNRNDVKLVQGLLNQHKLPIATAIREDGLVGPKTITAIEEFQKRVVKMSLPDGRVDPTGATWLALTRSSALSKSPSPSAAAAVIYKDSLTASEKIVSQYSFDVIAMVMANAGCSKAVISSTIRTPEEQVDIMYRNAKANLAAQYKLYGTNGDTVLKVFEVNKQKPEAEVKKLMVAKVKELLSKNQRVSLHVTTPEAYRLKNIIDVGVNSTQIAAGATFNKAKITEAFKKAEKDGYIDNFIDETNKSNNCWHVEITPNKKPVLKK